MTAEARAVLKQALRLDAVARAEIIDALYNSFDKEKNKKVDELWREEAESRIMAYEKGKIKADSASAVLKRIGKK